MRVACVACACVSVVSSVSLQSAEARIRLTDSEIHALDQARDQHGAKRFGQLVGGKARGGVLDLAGT